MNGIIKYPGMIIMILLMVTGLKAQNVEVTVTGLRSDNGQIVVGVFIDNDSFREENTFLKFKYPKTNINNGEMLLKLNLAPGVYGLSLLDDENMDSEMEYSKLGIPKEGFGFSDYYLSGFTRPKFDSFKFTVTEGQVCKITVKMRYI